jgi:NDP-sugar pyrophosphorylase family protein
MAFIDYGASLYRAAALERIPPDEPYDLGDLSHLLAADGLLAGYEVSQRFYEIGSVDGIRETDAYLRARRGA